MNAKPAPLDWDNAVIGFIQDRLQGVFGLVEDADHLLSAAILQQLLEDGWQVANITEPLMLRFEYETRLRSHPAPEDAHLRRCLFVFDFPPAQIPYDIQQAGSLIHLALEHFFPRLSPKALRQLPPAWLPLIYQSQPLTALDEAGTARLALRACLGLENEVVSDLPGFLELLAEIAGRDIAIPPTLHDYLVSGSAGQFMGQNNLARLLEAPQEARQFLQQIWEAYLHSQMAGGAFQVAEANTVEAMRLVGVLDRGRQNQDQFTRLLLDNALQPAQVSENTPLPPWMRSGVHYFVDEMDNLRDGLNRLLASMPPDQTGADGWLNFTHLWAGWRVARYSQKNIPADILAAEQELENQAHARFLAWLLARYASLLQQPYLPYPATVSQVTRYLAARHRPTPESPLAVLVLDGMALEDWLVIRDTWQNDAVPWQIEEHAIFAMLPTLTSVSRQSLLSGKLPRHFSASWLTTRDEYKLWHSFWEGQGVHPGSIAYLRGLGVKSVGEDEPALESDLHKLLARPNLAVVALIVNTVDDLAHSSLLGPAALHAQLRLWAGRGGYLRTLVAHLLERFSSVVITSDHGHIEGQGIGDIPLSSVAEERALRARIFSDQAFGGLEIDENQVLRWPNLGLPDEASVFLPRGSGLFAAPGVSGISHGGATLLEVVVPLVQLTR